MEREVVSGILVEETIDGTWEMDYDNRDQHYPKIKFYPREMFLD